MPLSPSADCDCLSEPEELVKADQYAAKGLNVSCRTLNGEAYIFNQRTRSLMKLDKVGSFIWDLIDGSRSIVEIASTVSETYQGDGEEVKGAVADFVDELVEKDVVVLSAEPFKGEMLSAC